MPIPKIEVTNPEAIELINKFKSGQIIVPFKEWLKKNKWYVIAAAVAIVLLIALVIGKKMSETTPAPTFVPPEIENTTPTIETTAKSEFSALKEEIQNMNTDLPDPFIPVYDNAIDLEETIN